MWFDELTIPRTLRPFDRLRVVLSNVEGRQAQGSIPSYTEGRTIPSEVEGMLGFCRSIKDQMATPKRILDMGWDFARSRALATGVRLDIFTHIADGKHTAGEIARAANSSLRGVEILLNALVGLELLTKDKSGLYHLAADSEEYLVRGKPGYLGSMSMHTSRLNDIWSHLTESVKTGKPYMSVDENGTGEEFFPELVRALFSMNYPASKYVASYLKKMGKSIYNILDVGAGSGVWGIGCAQEFPQAKLTAIDLPSVCKVAAEYAKNFGLSKRFECIEADVSTIDFGKNCYDIVILGHICHSEGAKKTEKLIKKSYDSLRREGSLVIADFLPNDEKTGPAVPLLFALNMLVNTEEGEVYTVGQFRKWLTGAGFQNVETLEQAPSISPLILAMK